MSALSRLVEQGIDAAMASHPKLFVSDGVEKARAVLVREVVKVFTRKDDEPAAEATVPAAGLVIEKSDRRAQAYLILRRIAGAVAPNAVGDKIFIPPEGLTACVDAFAECPPQSAWIFLTEHRHLTAWFEFFDETLPNATRRSIIEERDGRKGALLPWPWPPSKTGKIYTSDEAAVA